MANFQEAIGKTLLFEGGYVFNPHDSGGETYRGISRNNWPHWEGWPRIDVAKARHDVGIGEIPGSLDTDSILQGMIVSFYLKNFWNYNGIEDQQVADKVFDLGVNIGKGHAVRILQQAVGTTCDGIYGPNTERLVNLHLKGSLAPVITLSAEQYHKQIVLSHPEDAEFLRGWLRRDDS